MFIEKMTKGSAGFDIKSSENLIILPGKLVKVGTDLRHVLERGQYAIILSRSGMAFNDSVMVPSGFLIDSDYKGEWFILLKNEGETEYEIRKGDRIAQALVLREDTLGVPLRARSSSNVRVGGLGSTGI